MWGVKKIFLLSMFLFIIPTALSLEYPVTDSTAFETNFTLGTGVTTDQTGFKCFPFGEYIYCSYVLGNVLYIENFSSVTLVSQGYVSDDCQGVDCKFAECNALPISDLGKTIQCVAYGNDPHPSYGLVYLYTLNNNTLNIVSTDNEIEYSEAFAVTDKFYSNDQSDVYMVWLYSDNTLRDPRYADSYNLHDADGDGSINLPTKYEIKTTDLTGEDMALQSCGPDYGYLLFLLNSSSNKMSILQLDNDLNFIYDIENVASTWEWEADRWSTTRDYENNIVHFVATNSSTGLIGFWGYSCSNPETGGGITNVYTTVFNQTIFIPNWNASNNYMTKVDLKRDYDGERWLLFYEYNNYGTYERKLAIEGQGCDSCHWVLTDECYGIYQKYIRQCPITSDCKDLEAYNETVACFNEYQETIGNRTQGFEPFNWIDDCESGWVFPGQKAICEIGSFDIPNNCVNISVTESSSGVVIGSGIDDGNLTIESCVPHYECNSVTRLCSDIDSGNLSFSKTYTSYNSGDTITSQATFYTQIECSKNVPTILGYEFLPGFFDGVTKYKVKGFVSMDCQIACEEGWYCLDNKTVEYKQIDCTPTNRTSCGSTELCRNGECVSKFQDQEDRSNDVENAFSFILGSGNFISDMFLRPSTTQKYIWAFIISLICGVVGTALGSKGHNATMFGLVGLASGFILSIVLGFISPIWLLGIFAIVGLALYVKNM